MIRVTLSLFYHKTGIFHQGKSFANFCQLIPFVKFNQQIFLHVNDYIEDAVTIDI